jgi:TolB-like protein
MTTAIIPRISAIVASCVAVLLIAGPAAGFQDDSRPGVAVFEFDAAGSVGPDAMEMDNLGIGVQAMLLNELRQNGALRVVERRELTRLLDELALSEGGAVDPSTAAQAGKLVGARYMVFGSITDLFGEVVLTIRIVNVETGELIRSTTARDQREQFYDVLVSAAAQITEQLELPSLPSETQQARRERDVPPAAVILLANAEAAVDEGRQDRAIELYHRLTQEFPDYSEAQTALDQLLGGPDTA